MTASKFGHNPLDALDMVLDDTPAPAARPAPRATIDRPTPPPAARPTTRARRATTKVKATYEIEADIVEELKDAAVARMVDGDTVNSLVDEALRHGLAHLRDLYFNGDPPPARRRDPRPGRRPYN